jgi:hypothetical protein
MITYILLLLMSATPNPTFQMLAEFPDKPACEKFIKNLDATPESKELLLCQGFVLADAPGQEATKAPKTPIRKKQPKEFNEMNEHAKRDLEV